MAYSLVGKNFTPPDVRAKVTGKAKYAEDFRVEGMVFVKLLLSPMPNARIRNIDAAEALKMKGVVGILLPQDVPSFPVPRDPVLTMEPKYVGQPILAIAAEDETTAANALEAIKIDYEPLPFVVDPLASLYPGGPDVYPEANAGVRGMPEMKKIKWTAKDFAEAGDTKLPMGQPLAEWTVGDLDKGFADAALVLDESFVTGANSHHSMEPRSCMAYWQNGKCFLHVSTQSQSYPQPQYAEMLGIDAKDLVMVSEFCGGGFGSKGSAYVLATVPAFLSKKINRPCMMRVTRSEEYFLGSRRTGLQGRVKIGFNKEGRITAADVYVVQQNGATEGFPDFRNFGGALSLVYQPLNMRWRGISVFTNLPLSTAQRGPGQNQLACVMEPLMDKAARELKLDRLAIRAINAPKAGSKVEERQTPVSSAYMAEAMAMSAEKFGWAQKKALSGQRKGSKVTGIGIGQAYHPAGSAAFDGLVVIKPDGKLHIHTGIGNLGTYSYAATSRVAAEVLGYNWDNVVLERGRTDANLPWNNGQFGSNTSFTMSRTNYVAAMDAKQKLLEIAAVSLGGKAEDYDLANEKVVSKADAAKAMTFAEAATKAIEMGGKYSGKEMPADINALTKRSVEALAGSGLVGVAKDTLPMKDHVPAMAASFVHIELDVETGKYDIVDLVSTADCGTVLHPMGLANQIRGGAVMGIGMAGLEHVVYDPQNGLPANVGFYQAKPPSYLDVPSETHAMWVDKPDPQNPMGIKGVGEPLMGCVASALLSAISDALGGHVFNRTPVLPDMIVNAAAKRPQSHKVLAVNTQ
ncbi:MAG: xanthine dehydrogenase family protein molybdopterin-binding subunit [Rhodospirillaceae bacterium]|nr:xanthine dehydrogenase family protein molybdopterin-binding subunit [Rhodospirillaceae bacterium]